MRFTFNGNEMVEVVSNAAPFWDVKENMKEYFQEIIIEFLNALGDVLTDLLYSITLIGGGLLIIIWAVTGEKRAGKWFGILFILNAFVRLILR